MKTLYLSYDGITDQLGQSQVLPYIIGLCKKGHSFHLISFEKKDRFRKLQSHIEKLILNYDIIWHPLVYHKFPPVLSTMYDIIQLRKHAFELHQQYHFDIVHCRSYITAFVGLDLKNKFGIKFIFDMRGFYADERVDGNIWNLDNPVYKTIYSYFKKKEKQFLTKSDHVISLTEAAKKIISEWNLKPGIAPITVIPCCADLNLFNKKNISQAAILSIKLRLNIQPNQYVLSYLGAIGTWYMLNEMLDFFKRLLIQKPDAVFLFITHESQELILNKVRQKSIPEKNIRITSAQRNEVPSFISVSDASIFFIMPTFSKKASSPTKQGELMGLGIPIICNEGVGDTDEVIRRYHAGLIVKDLNDSDYDSVVTRINFMKQIGTNEIIKGATEFYSLEKGVEKYDGVYSAV